jgi:hypothetical protein
MYDSFNITPVSWYSGMNVKKSGQERTLNEEVLITNFSPATNLLPSPSPTILQQTRLI